MVWLYRTHKMSHQEVNALTAAHILLQQPSEVQSITDIFYSCLKCQRNIFCLSERARLIQCRFRLVNSFIMQAVSQIWSTMGFFLLSLTKHWLRNLTITETFIAFFVSFVRILSCLSTSCLSSDSLWVQLPLDSPQPSLPAQDESLLELLTHRGPIIPALSCPSVFVPVNDWNPALGFARIDVNTVL